MEEWKEYKLKDVTTILGDGLHGTPKYDENGSIFFINGNNLIDGKIEIRDSTKRVSENEANKYRKNLNSRTILVSINGTIGNVAKYRGEACILGKSACYFNVAEDFDLNFMYYVVASKQFKNAITHLATGTTIKNVSLETMRNYSFIAPSIYEQKRIANILSSLDDKIELNRRINENLEQQAQALFKSWFVDFEPFKDGKFVDSELGMIPEGWRVGVLADIANITMGQSPKGTSYNEIGDGISFYQGRAEFGNRFPSVRLFTTEPSRYAEPYSVLLSVRAPVGDINIAVERCCIGRGLASILSKNKHQSFVLYTMFFLKKELDKFNSEGTVFGSINRSSLENLKIIIPPVDIIDKFENLTSKIDVMLLNLFQETTSLAQLRDTLLPRLMSGELEIKDNSYD